MEKTALKTIADNRKARHDYFILESYEAGIELTGTEVKSIRDGGLNLKDSWILSTTANYLSSRCTSRLTKRATYSTRVR